MQCAKLTDDELWHAITQNTDELSALHRHLDADVRIGISGTPCARSRSYSEAVNKFECEYREYIAELDRRYRWSEKPRRGRKPILSHLVAGLTVANFVQYGLIAAFMSVLVVGMLSLRVH
jgi:hypothetical protein